jgi:hypothetical protein
VVETCDNARNTCLNALHVNAKKLEASAQRPDRQAQFEHIAAQKAAFMELAVSWYKIFHGKVDEAVP